MTSYFSTGSPETSKLGLQYLDDLKKEKLQAGNPHELMRAMETLSLLAVAEIFISATMFARQPNEWRILKKVDGKLKYTTRPINYKYPVELRR